MFMFCPVGMIVDEKEVCLCQKERNSWNLWENNRSATIGLPCFCSENRKSCTDSGKKGLDCIHFWVKFTIKSEVLRVSRGKTSKIFLCLFLCIFDEIFIKVL